MKRKQPKAAFEPRPIKQPRSAPEKADDRVTWRLGSIDFGGPWCWTVLRGAKKQQVYGKLGELERLTWGEVTRASGNKTIPIGSLCGRAQARLQEIQQEDIDVLWELRLTGTERVWGIRRGNVLNFLWWDPNHEVCPSKKKHT